MEELRSIRRRGSERHAYTEQIRGLFREEIPNLILYADSLDVGAVHLVHYISWENTLSMFSGRENPVLRMYNYEQSNDPGEGKIRPKEWESVLRNAKWVERILEDEPRRAGDLEYAGNTYWMLLFVRRKGRRRRSDLLADVRK